MSYPEVKFTMAPKIIAASLERRGVYSGIGDTMLRLKRWVGSKGIQQGGHPFCLYYDNPGETPLEELRSEACIQVLGRFKSEGKFRLKEFAAVQVAETSRPGPPEEFAKTFGPFLEGLLNEGYALVGPAREYPLGVADIKGPGSGFLIQQPIAKNQTSA